MLHGVCGQYEIVGVIVITAAPSLLSGPGRIFVDSILWKRISPLAYLILSRALSRPFSGILSQAPLLFEPFIVLSPLGFSFSTLSRNLFDTKFSTNSCSIRCSAVLRRFLTDFGALLAQPSFKRPGAAGLPR